MPEAVYDVRMFALLILGANTDEDIVENGDLLLSRIDGAIEKTASRIDSLDAEKDAELIAKLQSALSSFRAVRKQLLGILGSQPPPPATTRKP